ncbi:hypothetical protein D3C81_2275280 [compost metagenome]
MKFAAGAVVGAGVTVGAVDGAGVAVGFAVGVGVGVTPVEPPPLPLPDPESAFNLLIIRPSMAALISLPLNVFTM